MTVTEIYPGAAIEATQPLKVVRKLELEWDDPHPLDDRCLFVDHRAAMHARTHVSATGASEFLAVRIDLPNGEHFLISLTRAAQANLATAIEDARTRWDA